MHATSAQPSAVYDAGATPSPEVIVIEPLARSTGHQSWYARNLTEALNCAGPSPTLVTFDGMHEDADLALAAAGCTVHRVSAGFPMWLRRGFARLTGIRLGTTAAPSTVRRSRQMYWYNQLATALSVICGCRIAAHRQRGVLHLLCPPNWLALACLCLARRRRTRAVVTVFAPGHALRGPSMLVRHLCRRGVLMMVAQTEALAAEWAREVGLASVRLIPLSSGRALPPADRPVCRRVLGLPPDQPIVAVIGAITPQKGYVELFRALHGQPKNFRVLLIGDTPPWVAPDPESVAREAGWWEQTTLRREFVPEHQMPFLFGAVDAVALLYREPNASSGILSLCRQYGVPVLATRFGEIGAAVRAEQLGVTVDPNDPDEVRRSLVHLLGGDWRVSRAYASDGEAEEAGWADSAASHLRLYEDLENRLGEERR